MMDRFHVSLNSSRNPMSWRTANPGWRLTRPKVLLLKVRNNQVHLRDLTFLCLFFIWNFVAVATCHLIGPNTHNSTCSPFLHPGGSADIELEVFVNRVTAPDLNYGKEQIEDILVLHLERGKDYFISVTGNYLPSCYGTSIYTLCHLREPIRDMPQDRLRELVRQSLLTCCLSVEAFLCGVWKGFTKCSRF